MNLASYSATSLESWLGLDQSRLERDRWDHSCQVSRQKVRVYCAHFHQTFATSQPQIKRQVPVSKHYSQMIEIAPQHAEIVAPQRPVHDVVASLCALPLALFCAVGDPLLAGLCAVSCLAGGFPGGLCPAGTNAECLRLLYWPSTCTRRMHRIS